MNRTARLIATVLAIGIATTAGAQRLSIGQVDTGRLLIGQRVDLYVSLDLPPGATFDPDSLQVFESAEGQIYQEVDEVIDVASVRNIDAPLSFYMLVDNSGSMYDENVPGAAELRRIDAARQAIRDFANSITNEQDRIGLAVFNTGYRELAAPGTDKARIGDLLETIEEPAREDAYTELYAALIQASTDATAVGRRTVVVLSDGENYPYSVYEDEPSPAYGSTLHTPEEAIDAFQREGLSLFAIHYGDREDPNLGRIAAATGGEVYRARGPQDLARVYQDIRSRLLEERLVSYRATMIPAERRIVRVTYSGDGVDLVAERPYFANTLFAGEAEVATGVLIAVLVAGLLGLAALLLLSYRFSSTGSSLVLIDSGGARGLEKTVVLGGSATVIGASPDADVTIAGSPAVSDRHAVVEYEPKRSEYTIVSDSPVRVNNQPTKRRVLKPGDVINVEGTIFAYDEPDDEGEKKKR
ncbi:MAG: VWA domain-containing protein [Spirochaetota bacterium]